ADGAAITAATSDSYVAWSADTGEVVATKKVGSQMLWPLWGKYATEPPSRNEKTFGIRKTSILRGSARYYRTISPDGTKCATVIGLAHADGGNRSSFRVHVWHISREGGNSSGGEPARSTPTIARAPRPPEMWYTFNGVRDAPVTVTAGEPVCIKLHANA